MPEKTCYNSPMSTLRLRLFGLPHFEASGGEVAFGRRRALALIAYLAVTRQPQSRDRLLGLLWPDFDPSSARNNLRRELSLLNALAGAPLLDADRQSVAIAPSSSLWIDVEVSRQQLTYYFQMSGRFREAAELFTHTLERIKQRDLAGQYRTLRAQLACYKGWFYLRLGQFERTEATFLAGHNLYTKIGIPHLPPAGLERAYDEAIRLYEESLGLYRQLSDIGGLAAALGGLAKVRWASNQPQAAVDAYGEALQRAREISYLPLTLSLLAEMGAVFLEAGHRERGAELLAIAFYHPASGQEVRDRAKGILEQYNLQLAQPQVATAIDLTEPAAFAEVMAALPAELNAVVARYRSNEAPVVS